MEPAGSVVAHCLSVALEAACLRAVRGNPVAGRRPGRKSTFREIPVGVAGGYRGLRRKGALALDLERVRVSFLVLE